MRQPAFAHLTGQAMWRRCDHSRTMLASAPWRVMLAPAASDAKDDRVDPGPWLKVRGAAAVIPCPPDLCADAAVVLVDPDEGLFALSPDGWRPLPTPRPRVLILDDGAPVFAPAAPPAPASPPIGIALDAARRIWLLDRTPPRLRVLAPDFTVIDTQALPASANPGQVAASSWCVAVSNSAELLVQPFGGAWRSVALEAPAVAIAASPKADFVAVLLPGPKLGVLRRSGLQVHPLPGQTRPLFGPLFMVVTGPDELLVGSPRGAPGVATETRFLRYRLGEGDQAVAGDAFAVRSFDGRALWIGEDGVYASTASGARKLYARPAPLEADGVVETFHLDSTVFAGVWHRVFVDACVPAGTSIVLECKTTDDLPPWQVVRSRHEPVNYGGAAVAPAATDVWPRLISSRPEEPDWQPLGVLDVRGAMADVPNPPPRLALPSEDPLGPERSAMVDPWPQITLEGLIKAPPGRYLALRIRLSGTARTSPAVLAVRATYQRPSLLEHLPAYWRADPVTADTTDRSLALFEGWVTENDARVTALRALADPRLAPPEALDWLASYVALVFDQRLDEPVRRQLLMEASKLYQQRGTVLGLTRLLSILAQAPVAIVEGFKLRRQTGVFLDNAASVVGPGLQMGDGDSLGAGALDPADVELETSHIALMLRRAAIRAGGGEPCPAADPPEPIEADPFARFVRRFAHRFTVVLPACRTEVLEGVIQDAVEANKPAHTLHALCWLDAGFQLGRGSYVGLARLGETPCFEPGVLGAAVLGAHNTLGEYAPDARFQPGQRLVRDHRSIAGGMAGP
jgi:phage tail-like protein